MSLCVHSIVISPSATHNIQCVRTEEREIKWPPRRAQKVFGRYEQKGVPRRRERESDDDDLQPYRGENFMDSKAVSFVATRNRAARYLFVGFV